MEKKEEAQPTKKNELLMLIQSHRNASMDLNEDPGRFWAELFRMYVIEGTKDMENTDDEDDLLWYVKKTEGELGEDPSEPVSEKNFFVCRKTDSELPAVEDPINWEETVYLNTIMLHFKYNLSIAVCRKKMTQNAKLEIIHRVNKRVYASPSKRRMDSKAGETIFTYPQIYFAIDDFEECFKGLIIEKGQQICVQLSAFDPKTKKKCTLFQGGVLYDALHELFDWKKSGWAKLWKGEELEFLPLVGPRGKGKAQVAVGIADSNNVSGGSNLFQRFTSSFSKPEQEHPPLNTFLTYITLSWESIINDLLWK